MAAANDVGRPRTTAAPATTTPPSQPSPEIKNETIAVRKDTQSFDYVWRSGVAGGIAGCAAKTVVAPLDRVKILFQASNPQFAKYSGSWAGVATAMRKIHTQDGILGLYRGHSATLLRIFPYAGIKFLAYEQVRSLLIRRPEHETPIRRLASGAAAGVSSVFFTYPLEVVRVRLAFETKHGHSSFRAICRRIYSEHRVASSSRAVSVIARPLGGVSNFYRGFAPTILGMLPYAGISFLTHDTVGDILRQPRLAKWTILPETRNTPHRPGRRVPLRSWAELLSGGIAGLVSQTCSYPLEVIRRRMQVGGAVGDGHRLRIAETAGLIFRERGFRGFFVGLTIGYAKVAPMVAVSFFTYERGKLWLGI
ncbi:hypothetical protein ACRALDRAFT_1033069 [Sodiomyces alcalophilus JCM 7366]|uniref:uncharacterized protein n=1 Tax=Sodiomyces alcalophilus JCM 7366 TaxID=591952 RepID=UPI0039B63E17